MYKFNLPSSTLVNRFLAKKNFEAKVKNGKKIFENINRITLIHKLSSKSINTSETKNIKEILIDFKRIQLMDQKNFRKKRTFS